MWTFGNGGCHLYCVSAPVRATPTSPASLRTGTSLSAGVVDAESVSQVHPVVACGGIIPPCQVASALHADEKLCLKQCPILPAANVVTSLSFPDVNSAFRPIG